MASIPSLSSQLMSDVAAFTADDIDGVLINDTLEISVFETKSSTGGVVTLEYIVPFGSVATITNIKIKNVDGLVLATSAVYVPVVEEVVMKHLITVKEGV